MRRSLPESLPSRRLKWLPVLFLMVFLASFAKAQQDPMYSMYMFNGLAVNPAYAGSRDALSITALYRKQWFSVPGAPQTQNFFVHLPSRDRIHGFGFNIVNDQISYINQTWLTASYAYRIKFDRSKLAFGLQGMLHSYRVNWSKADPKDPNDNVLQTYGRNALLPNAGFGVYWYGERFYLGASAPHLLVTVLDGNSVQISLSDRTTLPTNRRHYFFTAGYVFPLGESVQLKPSFLGKYVLGAPFEADLNLEAFFAEKVGVGAGYRSGDGLVGMVNMFVTPQLRAGLAYDYPLTGLSNYTWGSVELMVNYDFRFKKGGAVSPRLF